MSAFDQYTNKDESFIRSVIVGFLATMQNKLVLKTQLGPNYENFKETPVKFYFATTGSERFLNDNFLNSIDFDPDYTTAETFYGDLPRGLVEFSTMSIESDSITNKYVRTTHKKLGVQGELRSYSSNTFFVPLKFDFTVSVYTDNMIDQLKLSEGILKSFYKNIPYNIEYSFNLVQCVISLSEDNEMERPIEYTFEDKKEYKVSFNCEVRTYLPVFIDGTSISEGTSMNTIISNVMTVSDKHVIDTDTREVS